MYVVSCIIYIDPILKRFYSLNDPLCGEYDNIGLMLRTTGGLYVTTIDKGELNVLLFVIIKLRQITPYSDYLSDPKLIFAKIRFKENTSNFKGKEVSSVSFFEEIKYNISSNPILQE